MHSLYTTHKPKTMHLDKQNNWQTRAAEFAQKRNLSHPPGVNALDLLSELGEVAKELLLATNYGQTLPQFRESMVSELGDTLFSLCMLTTSVGVDLDKALTQTLQKHEQRWQATAQLGSQAK